MKNNYHTYIKPKINTKYKENAMLNSEKLYKKLTELPELKNVPTMHIVMVAVALLKIIE